MMTDREKMICSIERCICRVPGACSCKDCDYNNHEYNECVEKLFQDILKLLKDQEPKPVKIKTNAYGTKHYYCPKCNKWFEKKEPFCHLCGQAVKWNE